MLKPPPEASSRETPRRTAVLGAVVAACPLFIVVAIGAARHSFSRPMFAELAMLFGIPWQVVIIGFALWWGAVGGYVVGTSRSRWVLPYVLLLFTFPACFAIVFAPAIVLILQNLG